MVGTIAGLLRRDRGILDVSHRSFGVITKSKDVPVALEAEQGKVGPVDPLFLKVDCHSLPVSDLEAGIEFYTSLGHELIWRDAAGAALRFPDSNAELVLHTAGRPIETDLSVANVTEAIERFVKAGGKLVHGPFDIRIGQCAVLLDPWDNPIVILDDSKGVLTVDEARNVTGNAAVNRSPSEQQDHSSTRGEG